MRTRLILASAIGATAALGAFSCAGGDSSSGGGGGPSGGAGGFGATGGTGATGGSGATGGNGGTGGSGATGGTGGTGGSGATGGTGGSGATGGNAGDASLDAPSDAADATADAGLDSGACNPGADAGGTPDAGCAAGQYWNPCKQSCVACTDLSWLAFDGAPTLIAPLSNNTGGKDQLYPRVQQLATETRVVLSQGVPQNNPTETDFGTATQQGASWSAVSNNLGQLVSYPGANDSAPLLLPKGATDPSNGTAAQNPFLLFDSDRVNGVRQVFASPFMGTGSPAPLAKPVNDSTAGSRDYSPAYAYLGSPPRLFWVSDRNTQFGLYTVAVTGGSVAYVPLVLDGGCPVSDEDVEPWVSPDGTVLFFSSPRREKPNCALALNGGTRALFYTYLDPTTGQQLGGAKELASVRGALETSYGKQTFSLRTPSLDPSFCTLYFSSNVDPTGGVDFDVFSAAR